MRWDHAGIKSTFDQFAAPVMGAAAGLHCNQAACGQLSAPEQKLLSLQSAIGNNMTGSIHGMDLNDIFSQIHTDSGNLIHRISPSLRVLRLTFRHTNLGIPWLLSGSGKSLRIHIGVDAESGLVHTVTTTAANAHDVTQAHALLHGEEEVVFGDSGYRGVEKREEIQEQHPDVDWQIAMMPGKRKALNKSKPSHVLRDKLEKLKAGIRAKVEHPFRVIKCQFGHRKTRYRGLAKNTSQLLVMFALSNLWMVRKRVLQGLQA
jgi:IS5 family transposase